MIEKLTIVDDGIGKVKIMLGGRDVTENCTRYSLDHQVGDALPRLTLEYFVKEVEVSGICVCESEADNADTES